MLARPPSVRFGWTICRVLLTLAASGLLGAMMIRTAPGFESDDRSLDPRFSSQSLRAFDRERATDRTAAEFYARYLGRLLHGDLGRSVVFGQSVAALVHERAGATIRIVVLGLGLGWITALLFAGGATLSGKPVAISAAMAVSGSLVSLPSGVLAIVCLLLKLPPALAIASVIFPRVFAHLYEQLRSALTKPHVIMARARGLSPARVFIAHVTPAVIMPTMALAGVTTTLAFGASIPVEALADVPGLGQLAWRAALGRDLPVLVTITLLLAIVTLVANVLADVISMKVRHPA
jgi:peptide/nickel transport system permease protein